MTQAERIVDVLRSGWHTYGELQSLRISTCPWVRLSESGNRYLRRGEVIARKTFPDGLMRLRVVKGRAS